MNNKKVTLAVLALIASNTVYAEVSSSLTLVSDYVFRGVTNTVGDPALQGSFDYSHDSGVYASLWASSVKFRENADVPAVDTVDEASLEIDYYLGMSGDFSDNLSWDAGLNYITYPGAEDDLKYDYWEPYAIVGYAMEEASLAPEFALEIYHSPHYFEDSGQADYVGASVSLSLPMEVAMSISAGKQTFKDYPDDDYSDWRVAVSKELSGLEFEIAYTDTDLSEAGCGGDGCDGRFVFSMTSYAE